MQNIDKIQHAIAGFLIAFVFCSLGRDKFGLLAGIVVGVAKEIYDYYHSNHVCDGLDAISTWCGAIIAFCFFK